MPDNNMLQTVRQMAVDSIRAEDPIAKAEIAAMGEAYKAMGKAMHYRAEAVDVENSDARIKQVSACQEKADALPKDSKYGQYFDAIARRASGVDAVPVTPLPKAP